MKVALVCSSFFLDRSYQENVWAEQLVKMGHMVRVISSGPRTTAPEPVHGATGIYEVQRVRTVRLPRSIYVSRHTAQAVRQFAPELIMIYGDKRFTRGVVRDDRLAHVPVISTYSENLGMHEFDWRKKSIGLRQRIKALGFTFIRRGPIRENCRRSDVIVGNTPHARDIVLRFFNDPRERAAIQQKLIDMPLGFSPEHYRFDPAVRQTTRAELGIGEGDIVVCTTSRFEPEKAASIRLVIDACLKMMPAQPRLRCMLVGFAPTATSSQIRQYIDSSQHAGRFLQMPFADRTRLNQLFNASEIAVYNLITISCQEALGTGLFCCFADDGSINHMVKSPEQASFFKSYDVGDLAAKLDHAVGRLAAMSGAERLAWRHQMAQGSRWLGYDQIIAAILDRLFAARRKSTIASGGADGRSTFKSESESESESESASSSGVNSCG